MFVIVAITPHDIGVMAPISLIFWLVLFISKMIYFIITESGLFYKIFENFEYLK